MIFCCLKTYLTTRHRSERNENDTALTSTDESVECRSSSLNYPAHVLQPDFTEIGLRGVLTVLCTANVLPLSLMV